MAPPPGFELRAVEIGPEDERLYDEEEWRDALVVVRRGEIELECVSGSRCWFGRGSVLWLGGLPLRAIRNRRSEAASLVALRPTDEFARRRRSYLT